MNNIINELVKKIDNPNIVKALIIGFIALYVIAPDAIPGPADDMVVAELVLIRDGRLTVYPGVEEGAE